MKSLPRLYNDVTHSGVAHHKCIFGFRACAFNLIANQNLSYHFKFVQMHNHLTWTPVVNDKGLPTRSYIFLHRVSGTLEVCYGDITPVMASV